jgi:SAM-dependent methyltransferase
MQREDWNQRYTAQPLLWGVEPNGFIATEFAEVRPRGRALDLGCGEGRNAIWLAERGWYVTAVDYSDTAIERARRLAADRHVNVEWIEADVTTFAPPAGSFQLVLISYLHLPAAERRAVLAHAAAALGPGGTLFMVGHARRNLIEGVGGPRQADVLWEPSEIGREVTAIGLVLQRAEHVRRPVETADDIRDAIDTVLRAERVQL